MYVPSLQIPAILFINLWKLLLSNGLPSAGYSALLRTFQSTLFHNNLIFPKQLHLNQWIVSPTHPNWFFLKKIQLPFTLWKKVKGLAKGHTCITHVVMSGWVEGEKGGGIRTFVIVTTIKAKKVPETISFPLSCLILWKCITESTVIVSFAAPHSESFWWIWAF